MGTLIQTIDFKNACFCSFCNKRIATKCCDFPIGTSRYIGHPPLNQMQEAKQQDVAWKKIEMSKTITCDKPLCDKCAFQITSEIDFCPEHYKIRKNEEGD